MAKTENGKLTLKIASYNLAGGNYDKDFSNIAKDRDKRGFQNERISKDL